MVNYTISLRASVVMFARLCPSARISAALSARIYVKSDIENFYEILLKHSRFW